MFGRKTKRINDLEKLVMQKNETIQILSEENRLLQNENSNFRLDNGRLRNEVGRLQSQVQQIGLVREANGRLRKA